MKKTIPDFVQSFLSEREDLLKYHATKINKGKDYSEKLVGPFIANVQHDVKKETKPFIEKNGIRWRYVREEVSQQAKEWYINNV